MTCGSNIVCFSMRDNSPIYVIVTPFIYACIRVQGYLKDIKSTSSVLQLQRLSNYYPMVINILFFPGCQSGGIW